MCRLAYIPGKAKISKKDLLIFLDNLEISCGGDGNGFVAISPTAREFIHQKALKLCNEAIVEEVAPLIRKGWGVYYHTRKVSVGWKEDAQCHPFEIKGRAFQGYVCHNGTWFDGEVLAKYLKVGSDTAAIAHLFGKFGYKGMVENKLFPNSGVFMVHGRAKNGDPSDIVIKKSGDLCFCPTSGVWASDFEEDWPYYDSTYEVSTGIHHLEKMPQQRPIVTPKATASQWHNTSNLSEPDEVKNYYGYGRGFTPGLAYRHRDDVSYTEDFEAIDSQIDSTHVDRNLLDTNFLQ